MLKELERYLESLTVTQGYRVGESFALFPWERRFLRGVFRTNQGDAALSVARGAGKTTLISTIGAAALTGPLAQARGETVIVGPSLNQARISFDHIKHFLSDALRDRGRFRVWDSTAHSLLEDRQTGAILKCQSCEPKRLHGLAPSLLILDEPAQWAPNIRAEAYGVLQTSRGKIEGSRLIALGTKPLEGTEHFFNDLLKVATYSQIHAAGKEDNPFIRKTWEKACPSLKGGGMPALMKEYREEAARAKKNPAALASFKALRLNLGTRPVDMNAIIDVDTWREAEGDVAAGRAYVLGLDLSDGAAMSAAAAYSLDSGRLDGFAAFPSTPGLKERGLKDGVGPLYVKCQERGELIVTDGRAVDVPAMLRECLRRWGRPVAIVADRYREKDLRQALDGAKFPQAVLVLRGQGFKDGAEDVRQFRRAVLDGKVFPVESLLLRAAFGEAVTISDPAGNEKQAKGSQGGRRSRARDDAASAAVLAVAEGARRGAMVKPTAPAGPVHRVCQVTA